MRGLCLILDQETVRIPPERALSLLLSSGITCIQYRNKPGSKKDLYETALQLLRQIRDSGGLFIMNDHADIAAAIGADGVHLGQDDLPIGQARKILGSKALIGISTHSLEQAIQAQLDGADYIGFGPIFRSATKDAGGEQGTAALAEVRKFIRIPIIAIGGITLSRVRDVLHAGADGVAVISGVLGAKDIKTAAGDMVREVQTVLQEK